MSQLAQLADVERWLPEALIADRRWAEQRLATIRGRIARQQPVDRMVIEVADRLKRSGEVVQRRGAAAVTISYPAELPVSQRREEILASLRAHPVLVLTGETGSGKTTQLPKMLLESGYGRRGMIALTQPRRVAAVAMADRIREECQAPKEAIVHSVRFDDNATDDTLIRVMTDGLLLAEVANDPDLSRYDAIIVDEAHERSLNIDLLLGLLKLLRVRRPELAIVIASASIEARRFAGFFARLFAGAAADAPVIEVTGRLFPVDIRYLPPADDDIGYLAAAVQAVRDVVEGAGSDSGDLLVFLPTERDILDAQRRLHDLPGTAVLPLFGRLTPHEQQRVFQPPPGRMVRKVVLATNIAETSLTIPGIRYVIDTGLSRFKRYQAASRTERLPIEAISQASATQRAGRAGRVEAGVCIRLYAADDLARRDAYTAPEILRSNLAGVMLTCLHLGFGDPGEFPWLDAPSPGAWQQAHGLLDELGAFREQGGGADERTSGRVGEAGAGTGAASVGSGSPGSRGEAPGRTSAPPHLRSRSLSPLGRTLAAIPADPQVARILIAGLTEGCAHEACTIAAFLSVQDPRVRPMGQEAKADAAQRELAHEAGDLATILTLWDRWNGAASNSAKARLCDALYLGYRRMREWSDVRHQLWHALRERGGKHAETLPAHGSSAGDWPLDAVHRAVLAGLLGNVLMYDAKEKAYRASGDRLLAVHPGSALRAREGKAAPAAADPERPRSGVQRGGPAPWLVACEVVETSRLFARLCAPIDPRWVEDLAGDRVRRRHRDPQWHPQRQEVVCIETITWKGLPIRDGRLVPYERIDPVDAQRVFIRQGLCDEDGVALPQIQRNRALIRFAETLKHRLRDPSLDIDRSQLASWYAQRLATLPVTSDRPLASTRALQALIATSGEDRLRLSLTDLVPPDIAARAERGAPDTVVMGGRTFPLHYRFIPGDTADGVTITVAESDAALIDPIRLDWLVPAWYEELVDAYAAQLPKDQRRKLIPLADAVRVICAELPAMAGRRPFAAVVADVLRQRSGITGAALDPSALPPHLRPRFQVRSSDGSIVYDGRDPAFLAAQSGVGGDRLRLLRAEWETPPGRGWPGDLPSGQANPGGKVDHLGISGFVALGRSRDATGAVAVRRTVYGSREAADAWHEDGLDAALEASLSATLDRIATAAVPGGLSGRCEKLLGVAPGVLRRHLAFGAVLELDRSGIRSGSAFAELLERANATVTVAATAIDPLLTRLLAVAEQVQQRRKQGARSLAAAQAATSVALVADRLLVNGWQQRLPWSTASRMDLLLTAQLARLEGKGNPKASDRIVILFEEFDAVLGGDPQRLLSALGLVRRARGLTGLLHDTIAALSQGLSAGPLEMRLRTSLSDLDKTLGTARDRIAETRHALIEASRLIPRIPVADRRDRLGRELADQLKDFPDLSLGADLADQHRQAAALIARLRAALG